jgi:hypothetical protein
VESAGGNVADSHILASAPDAVPPPDTLMPGVSWLSSRLDELRDTLSSKREVDATLLIPTQAPGVLSILGEQGIGKSTTLKYVCDKIASDETRLMTPVVSPERFADGDTLFGWVLTALTDLLPKRIPEAGSEEIVSGGRTLTLPQLADLIRRQEALARGTYQDASAMVSASPDEWAEGTSAVTTAGLHLVRGWVDLLNGLADHVSQVVIPVDDTDQVPSLLPNVLRDLRWLTIHPLVAVVLCANEEMLLQTLTRGPELRSIEKSSRTRLALGSLTKALPQHLRLNVPPVSLIERSAFLPPGETETLVEILKSFPFEEPPPIGPATLGDFFELHIGNSVNPSPYVEILPETPRQLDQLWRELRGIALEPDDDKSSKTAKAGHCLITRAITRASERTPDLPQNTLRFFTVEPQGLSVEFDFSQVSAGLTVGAGSSLINTDTTLVTMRRVDGFHMRQRPVDKDSESARQSDFPTTYTNANFLALDLSDPEDLGVSPFYLWGYVYKLSDPGGPQWRGNIDVRFHRKLTDNLFAPVPTWESRFDYYLYASAWNGICSLIQDLECKASTALLEWILLRHVLIVCEIQANRAISPALVESAAEELRSLDENWSSKPGLERFATMCDELYKGNKASSTREGDFAWWIEVYLAWTADDILGVPEFGSELLAIRKRLIKDRDNEEQADRDCGRQLRIRIEENLSAEWITSTIALLDKINPDFAQAMAGLHEVAREERDTEIEAFAAALERRGVPRELVGQMFLTGMTSEVARQLQAVGLPSAAIEALASRFGPIESEGTAALAERLDDEFHER